MEQSRLHIALRALCENARARTVAMFHPEGHLLHASGDLYQVDLTSLGALVTGAFSAGTALVGLVDDKGCDGLFVEGKQHNLYLTKLGSDRLLLILFGAQSNEGVVRFRVKQARVEIEKLLSQVSGTESSSHEQKKITEPRFEEYCETKKERYLFEGLSDQEIEGALGI